MFKFSEFFRLIIYFKMTENAFRNHTHLRKCNFQIRPIGRCLKKKASNRWKPFSVCIIFGMFATKLPKIYSTVCFPNSIIKCTGEGQIYAVHKQGWQSEMPIYLLLTLRTLFWSVNVAFGKLSIWLRHRAKS